MTRRTDDTGKLVLRMAIGGLMFLHGLAKVRDNSFVEGAVLDAGLPAWMAYGVFIGEVVAPVLLIIGLFTRVAAGLVAIDMLFALALVHTGDFGSLTPTGAWAVELPLLFLMGAVTVALVGPGRYAVAWNPTRDLVWAEPSAARERHVHSREPITHRL
jgi:putative oxidoreductase